MGLVLVNGLVLAARSGSLHCICDLLDGCILEGHGPHDPISNWSGSLPTLFSCQRRAIDEDAALESEVIMLEKTNRARALGMVIGVVVLMLAVLWKRLLR